jgi:hypothetical protein
MAAATPNAAASEPGGASSANRTWLAGTPRRTVPRSITSSWTRADVCSSSRATPTFTMGSPLAPPAARNAQ